MHASPIAEPMPPRGRGTGLASQADTARTLDWEEAEQRFNRGGWCWLATVHPGGGPHVMPVFAVWSASAAYVTSKDSSRKSRNLAAERRCVVSTDAGDAHLIVEGAAKQVHARETLERASQAFETVYGWPTTVSGDQLDADYGAPTSGGPPYSVYEITPTKAFALPSGGDFMPTRWNFSYRP